MLQAKNGSGAHRWQMVGGEGEMPHTLVQRGGGGGRVFSFLGLGCPRQNWIAPWAMPAATFDAKKIYCFTPAAHTVRGLWNPLGMVFRNIIDKMSMVINTQNKRHKGDLRRAGQAELESLVRLFSAK